MKPSAALSLDLDNQWSYQKTHGDAGWESHPSYLGVLLPLVLDFFHARGLRLTFFVVGQDAALDKNREPLARIVPAGHEIGNHSFHHEPWLHRYTADEVRNELARAEEAIEEATGEKPTGFRGPGFSVSTTVLEALVRMGYEYDASTFPTYLGPLARAYYFMTASLSAEDRKKRDALFGSVSDGIRPVQPYWWQLASHRLLEIPVTTFPLVKAPFHLSYILYLSKFSPWLARRYFKSSLLACRTAGVGPSLLLHPLDFLGSDDVEGLAFFPGMDLPGSLKRERVSEYLDDMRAVFDVVPLGEYARELKAHADLGTRNPDFSTLEPLTVTAVADTG